MKGGRGMREEGGNYWREEERTEEEGKGGRKDWRGKQKVRSGGEKKKEWGEREWKDGRRKTNHTSSVKFFSIALYCGDDLFSSSLV